MIFLAFAFHGPGKWAANQAEFGFFVDHFTFLAGLLFAAAHGPGDRLALRQGFGRLIRTRTDRGIVALLDVRVGRKAYGRQLLAGLPPARRFREIGPLAEWFRSGGQVSPD